MDKEWEKPACDICKSNKFLSNWMDDVTTWEHEGKYNFVKCGRCGLVFQSPRPPLKEAINYYPSEAYWGRDVKHKKRTPGMKKEREESYGGLYREIFNRVKKGKILDIGSGLGLFLSKFKEKGWEVLGTDISSDVAKYSKKVFGIKTLEGDLSQLNLPKKHFDVVSMISVMEHVYSPRDTLRKIKTLTKNGALFVLLIPNADGMGRYVYKKDWIQLQPARHLYLFNPSTINRLLEEEGFEVLKISHNNWKHNFYSSFQSFRYKFSPKLAKSLSGGLLEGSVEDAKRPSSFSLKKELGKIIAFVFSLVLTFLEQIFKRADMIAVYAKAPSKR